MSEHHYKMIDGTVVKNLVDKYGNKFDEFQAVYHQGNMEDCLECKEESK